MKLCLDTNIIIDIFRGDVKLQEKVEKLDPRNVCITPLTLAELFKGANLAQRKSEALALIDDFIQNIDVLDFSEQACVLFGKNYATLARQGKLVQELDLMIGSIALAHNAVLVTRNIKDFVNIKGLRVLSL
jgi:tRNA(fMet)-specific endonuclease VapC